MESIFRKYDIRGIYPDQIDEKKVEKIGQALANFLIVAPIVSSGPRARAPRPSRNPQKIVVGRDTRKSSPQLAQSLTKGITSQGVDVIDIGKVSTDGLYFALSQYDVNGGVMITASHNPPEYNGCKVLKKLGKVISPIKGEEIGIIFKKDITPADKRGAVKKKNIWEDYVNHLFSFVDVDKIKPLSVVVDASNGMAGKVMPKIKDKLPAKIIPLNFKLDGNFPSHSPDPTKEEAKEKIRNEVKKQNADLGAIFDGDADRVFLISEKGEYIPADVSLLLLAKSFLKKSPGSSIVYNLTCSKATPEFIKKWGGKAIRSPVGYVNVWENMRKSKAIVGGEISGHYAFRENSYCDSGFIAFLTLLEIISESGKKLSQLTSELHPYYKPPKTNLEIKNKEKVLEKVKQKYSDGEQDYLDGVTVSYEDWWFNVRPSGTEPLLRVTIEADNKEIYLEKKEELLDFIKSISK